MKNLEPYNSRRTLLKDIFFSPKSAFEYYFQQTSLGGKDILMIHLNLAFLGALMKIFGNLIQIFVFKVTSLDEDSGVSVLQGVFPVFIFYIFFFGIFRLLDSFRMYHKMRDKSKNWEAPESHVFIISFLPFTSTAVFWILPPPFPFVFIALGFLYSLQLSYMYLSMIGGWSSREFFFFFIKAMLFFLTLAFVPLLIYNIIRTVLF